MKLSTSIISLVVTQTGASSGNQECLASCEESASSKKMAAACRSACTPQGRSTVCEDGVHAHQSECNAYYQCANGIQFEDQYCPEGLVFNPEISVCDYPHAVAPPCGTYQEATTTTTTTTTSEQPATSSEQPTHCEDGIYRVEDECNAFYQCSNGHRWPNQYCPAGLFFNGQVCDWPENVECGNDTTTTTTTTTTTQPEQEDEEESYLQCVWACKAEKPLWQQFSCYTICASSEEENGTETTVEPENEPEVQSCEDGIYPIPDDCTGFYQCSHGHRWPNQYCPSDLLFNGQVCDWPENVECEGKLEIETCQDGIHAVPNVCNAYYQCANGIRFETQYCPEGLLFNGQVCDWPSAVDCNTEPETTTTTEPTTTSTTTTTPTTTSTTTSTTTTSTTTTSTSTTTTTTEEPTTTTTTTSTTTTTTTPTTTTEPTTTTSELATTTEGERETPILDLGFKVITGLRKVQAFLKCYWECKESNTILDQILGLDQKPFLKAYSCMQKCKDAEWVPPCTEGESRPHESNCGKYYECVEGSEIEQTCQMGKFFDSESGSCKWVWQVQCDLTNAEGLPW